MCIVQFTQAQITRTFPTKKLETQTFSSTIRYWKRNVKMNLNRLCFLFEKVRLSSDNEDKIKRKFPNDLFGKMQLHLNSKSKL